MKKGRSNLFFQIGLIFTIIVFSFSTFFCVAAYIKYTEDKSGAFGTIGLRSYFHCGTGTQEDPYVITRPKHLFNLSRLQSLGVFSEPKYFQLGYDLDDSGTYKVYKNDETTDTSLILDMKSYTGSDPTHTLSSIGNESTPFYGIFEGNGLEIANATVKCSLEDSGLFGYVASRAVIRNLLLDNITIKNDGYEPGEYGKLYSDQAGKDLRIASQFNIIHGIKEETKRTVIYSYDSDGISQVEDDKHQAHDNTNTLSFDISTETNDDSQNITFFYEMNGSSLAYSMLSSEDFFERDKEGRFTLKTSSTDKSDVFSFFDSYKNNPDAIYPLELSLTLSLVANYLDSSGINHAKVVSALNISFKKWLKDSKTIVMRVQPREAEHGNNMGLIVGHLDGSLTNVYVHDGAFQMNSESTNTAVDQKSMIGFVGLVGPTVANGQSDAANGNIASSGKDVGVLNFTGIYDKVVRPEEKFDTVTENNKTYYTYTPTSDNDYMDYLRNKSVNNQKIYYSSNRNTISLIAKQIIKDDETHNRGLGVFSIATDYRQGGEGDDVFLNIESSTIAKSKSSGASYDKYDSQNIFFSTYEYNKETNTESIENIENTLNNYTNDTFNSSRAFLPGNHIPLETTVENQSTYEKYYNFLFRFQLDPNKSDFYFSDLDSNTVGGSFLNNYFSYKLIDANGESLEPDSPQFGIMIKDKDRINISELTTNYRLDNSGKMFTIGDNDSNYSVSNSINFEIKTNEANVTILASNNETSGDSLRNGSMLGIYKLPDTRMTPSSESTQVPSVNGKELTWDNPDYGMVLPSTASLAFYEYNNGKIGSSKLSDSYFTETEEVTKENNNQATSINKITDNNSIELDDAYTNYIHHPIFAHTFKLPKGRYCLGSAIGNADVYYICAQGQENGDLSLSANVFSQINKIDNVDFLKTGLASDATANPYFSIVSDKMEQTASLTEQRCYLIFDSGNVSHFLASSKNASDKHKLELSMKYSNDTFVFSIINDSDLGSIETLALTNYGYLYTDNKTSIKVQLFGQTANTGKNPRYPA